MHFENAFCFEDEERGVDRNALKEGTTMYE